MKGISALVILSCLVFVPRPLAIAAPTASDWPALGADASQSNYNPGEKIIKSANALKLKVRWTSAIAEQSYPIVAAGHVYVPVVYK